MNWAMIPVQTNVALSWDDLEQIIANLPGRRTGQFRFDVLDADHVAVVVELAAAA